jgi:hypothetical protein
VEVFDPASTRVLFKVYLTMLSEAEAVLRRVVECFGKDLEGADVV